MRSTRGFTVLAVTALLLAACGDDENGATTTQQPATTVPATTTTGAPDTTVAPATTSTTEPVVETQPAIWPAADVVFTTPEAAATDFIAQVFGTPGPVLGAFKAGDQRSGEIEVFAADETGAPIGQARSVLLLRQLGPSDGWFVLAAVSDLASITTPSSGSTLAAGPVTVAGKAQGFEANIGISAFVAGRAEPRLDQTTTMAGNFGEVLPYTVTLDLSGATSGDLVVVLVHGGAGLETDPGDFSAIPVVIG